MALVVVDLSGVEFMAAATVSVILGTRARLHQRSRSLTVRSPSRCARRVLELCDLADLIRPAGVVDIRALAPEVAHEPAAAWLTNVAGGGGP
jgi:anti-anti-sigma factor